MRVLIVDDEELLRSGLRLVLDGAAGIEVVGEAGDGREGVRLARELAPDVVLMDVRMPGTDGITATRELLGAGAARVGPAPRVVVLTAFDTDDFILDALAAGAAGFLLKDTRPADLVAGVLAAAAGDLRFSPAVLGRLVALAARTRPAPGQGGALAELTDRERDVAVAVARGLTNPEIALELHITLPTVKTHLLRVFTKLEATNRVQVAIAVTEAGLLPR